MKLFRPSELRSFLNEKGLHAKKSLSQNFLIDGNIIQKIITMANIAKGDHVIEIGPGFGALTEALLQKGAHVLAIEKDPTYASELLRLQTGNLEVVCMDVLRFSFDSLPHQKYKVVANLPYHITTPILTLLLPMHSLIESITVMVQKEFADRMRAKAATAEYGSFSLFVQFYATVISDFIVKPSCFYPPPKVHSSVIHCKLHPPLFNEVESFFTLTRSAFGKRRKMLRSSLKELYPNIEKVLRQKGHLPTARPEELSLHDFIALYAAVQSK